MYSYTHVLTALERSVEDSYSESQFGILAYGSGSSHTKADISTTNRFSDIGLSFSGGGSGRTEYISGTYPRSVSAITASWTTFSSETTASSTQYQVAYTTSSSDTFVVFPIGSSTGVDSWTYTNPSTETYQFTTSWVGLRGGSSTALTASASGTRTNSITVTNTISGTTLVPVFAIDRATAPRWFVARQSPPPLRKVALAYAVTGDSSSAVVTQLLPGSHSWLTDFALQSTSSTDGFIDSIYSSGVSETYWAGKSIHSSGSFVPALDAARKNAVSVAMLSGSFGLEITASPAVPGSFWTASVASGLASASIWTSALVVSSKTYRWSHQSSSWVLHGSSKTGSSLSTFTIAVGLSGLPSTSTIYATEGIGLTTALLGPLVPLTQESFNILSISSKTTGSGHQASYHSFLQTSSGSSLQTFSGSSSEVSTIGTGSNFPATYDRSLLRWGARVPVFTMSTQTFNTSGNTANLVLPSLYSAAKWNEAGRGDAVSVVE